MADLKFKLPGPETIMLTGQAVNKLISAGDGEAALLYLYILKTNGQSTPSEAAAALGKSRDRVDGAMAVLSRLGLAHLEAGQEETKQADEPSPYLGSDYPDKDDEPRGFSVQDMKREMEGDSVFKSIVEEAQRSLGKILSPDELERLFGVYDALRMAPEVILLLITHCISESRGKKGGRMPAMRQIEKTAYTWAREGIFTLERAEEHLKAMEARNTAHGEIKRVLQIRDRDFYESEKRYVDSWIAMGFGAGAVAIACDITVLKTGKLTWKYMDSIINNWHNQGVRTPKEIQEKDKKTARNPGAGKPQSAGEKFGAADNEDIERMTRLLEKIKKG